MIIRFGAMLLLLLSAVLVSMALGSFAMSPAEIVTTLMGEGSRSQDIALFSIRLPRMVLAILVGMGLALSGAILQGVSRNALADPGILGLNAGAGFVIMALLYMRQMGVGATPGYLWPLAAFTGAALAAIAIYLLARKHGVVEPGRMLLSGIAVNAGLSAAMLVISMRLDRKVYDAAAVWLAGSLSGTKWADIAAILPWFVVLALVLAMLMRTIDILEIGDDGATGLGVAVEPKRLLLIGIAVALAGASVAFAGGIGFVGLLGPHIARSIVGPRHHLLLPATALIGATLMVLADTVGRNLLAPNELPVGVVVAAIGAPYFLYLLARSNR